jgi:hypothetical protein
MREQGAARGGRGATRAFPRIESISALCTGPGPDGAPARAAMPRRGAAARRSVCGSARGAGAAAARASPRRAAGAAARGAAAMARSTAHMRAAMAEEGSA